jgi:hypothetical protein
MSGLIRRIRGPRAAAADPSREAALEERPGASTGVPADLPAGVDAAEFLGPRPTTRGRGRLRKRLRHVRRVRELLLRDLGGLVYEVHRTGSGQGDGERLVSEKVARLQLLDTEVRDLEGRLDDRSGELLLREPGIGGTCRSCGELFGSEANFCANCGAPVAGGPAGDVSDTGGEQPASEQPTRVDELPGETAGAEAQQR